MCFCNFLLYIFLYLVLFELHFNEQKQVLIVLILANDNTVLQRCLFNNNDWLTLHYTIIYTQLLIIWIHRLENVKCKINDMAMSLMSKAVKYTI